FFLLYNPYFRRLDKVALELDPSNAITEFRASKQRLTLFNYAIARDCTKTCKNDYQNDPFFSY
ncbi:MAG TPA: hypothetical protein PK079_20370, partial [Leptospiraceae bacterium]|nr:hypothetical protein [Leptospiraceae bacterium]HMX35402.1 hypothetical protein [Leptospiraceae bacterium]HMY32213.1 hypothetical protein [Leptospiraceae bacterium]HNE11550.1 hypothetical protein [Leptospiraceae bacterium]HNE55538.1 hypothetical protein [Leptospiraceae bacterium]